MKNRYDRKILSKKKEIIKRAYSKNVNFPEKILSDYKKIKNPFIYVDRKKDKMLYWQKLIQNSYNRTKLYKKTYLLSNGRARINEDCKLMVVLYNNVTKNVEDLIDNKLNKIYKKDYYRKKALIY